MRALARVMRCSIALSPTRKARAICFTRQAGDDAQRERDLLGRRQVRMAADEQQAQDVVAIVRVVEPLGDRGLGIARDRRAAPRPAAAVCLAARRTASMPTLRPTMMSQAAGSRGGPFSGQVFSARRQASWNASSAHVEVAEVAQQRRDRLGTRRGQGRVDPGEVGHCASVPHLEHRVEDAASGGSRRRRRGWPRRGRARSRAPPPGSRSRRRRSRAAAPWSRRTARRSPRGSRSLRSVVAAVVGIRRGDRAQLAGLGQLLLDDDELRHHRVVLLLGPGKDESSSL